jgi:hypothetical protein
MSFFDYLVPVAVGAVAIVLVLGLINMMRGGDSNTSQKLMRARVSAAAGGHHRHHGCHLHGRPLGLAST